MPGWFLLPPIARATDWPTRPTRSTGSKRRRRARCGRHADRRRGAGAKIAAARIAGRSARAAGRSRTCPGAPARRAAKAARGEERRPGRAKRMDAAPPTRSASCTKAATGSRGRLAHARRWWGARASPGRPPRRRARRQARAAMQHGRDAGASDGPHERLAGGEQDEREQGRGRPEIREALITAGTKRSPTTPAAVPHAAPRPNARKKPGGSGPGHARGPRRSRRRAARGRRSPRRDRSAGR